MKTETKTNTALIELQEEGQEKKGKAEKKAGKRIGYNYIVVKSLKENKKNDVVKCLYIKSLTKWGFCVLKEGTLGDTKDSNGRDIRDRLLWQKELHEKLNGKVRLPQYLGSFEENGNYYLVIEYIKGKSLGAEAKKKDGNLRFQLANKKKASIKSIGVLIQIADILEILHKENIVHRDATGGNFLITKRGKVAVIDMELSYSLDKTYPSPPFQLGTAGFMSPQQEATESPTIHEDIYAFGAIVLQLWTGISPSKLTRASGDELAERVRFFIDDAIIAELVIKCLQNNAEDRPAISEIKNRLTELRSAILRSEKRDISSKSKISRDQVLEVAENGLNTICTPLMSHAEKGWFAPNQGTINEEKNKIDKAYYGSFQFGVAGPMYLFSMVSRLGMNIENAKPHIQSGLDRIYSKYLGSNLSTSAGLYFGAAGIAMSLNALKIAGLLPDPLYIEWIQFLLQRTNTEQSFLNGRAGHGAALLACSSAISGWDAEQVLRDDYNYLSSLQETNGSWTVPYKKNKRKVKYTFHGGMAGILYFLLDYYRVSGDRSVLESATRGLSWLMKHSRYKGGKLNWSSASGKELNYGWCEGVSGIAFTFLKAYETTGEPIFKKYASDTLMALEEDILDSNLSQCHGLTGLGEVYLEAFRILGSEVWLKRAEWITKLVLNLKLYNPRFGYYWLVEQEKFPIAGFMTGNSGVIHFLLRFYHNDKMQFPLLHVWNSMVIPEKKEKSHSVIA